MFSDNDLWPDHEVKLEWIMTNVMPYACSVSFVVPPAEIMALLKITEVPESEWKDYWFFATIFFKGILSSIPRPTTSNPWQ